MIKYPLLDARKKLGLTQTVMAENVCLTVSRNYQRWEKVGKCPPERAILIEIAIEFGMDSIKKFFDKAKNRINQ